MAVDPIAASAGAVPSLNSVTARLSSRFRIRGLLPWGDSVPYFRAESEIGPLAIAALPFECRPTTRADAAFHRLTHKAENLSGPGLPVLVRHGVEDAVPFLAYRMPEGRLLATILAEGRFPADVLLRVADTMLRALARTHSVGLVHGELAPESILIDERQDERAFGVTVLAMGFAQVVLDARPRMIRSSGWAPAQSHYRSPESLAGAPPSVASDIYSIGAILHHMVTGRPPGELEYVEAYAEAAGLFDVVQRAMSDDPLARFDSAEAMRAALDWVDVPADLTDVNRQDIPLWMESSTVADIPVPELIRRSLPPPSVSQSLPPLAPSLTHASARRSSFPPSPVANAPARASSIPPEAQPRPLPPPAWSAAPIPMPTRRPSFPPPDERRLDPVETGLELDIAVSFEDEITTRRSAPHTKNLIRVAAAIAAITAALVLANRLLG